MPKVRVRQIPYALTGSVDCEGGKIYKYRLEPEKWTEVPEEVYAQLEHKYGEAKYSYAPNSLPGNDGTYVGQPGQTRPEVVNSQYLIEFRRT